MSQFDRTLLERIEAAGTEQPAVRASFDKSLLLASILRNVGRVLNERRGSCEARPDYGLPDLNDAMGRGASGPSQFAATVQETIELFEPRLSSVLVRFVPDNDHPMRINYRISAMLQIGDSRERVSFDTILSEDKRIHVRG
jgi:type VI secretion system protein